jgi:phasin family protein
MLHRNMPGNPGPGAVFQGRKATAMAAKTKSAAEKLNGVEEIETAVKNSTEAFKNTFEKAVKNYDQFLTYGKETAEAFAKAAGVAGKGAETFNNEFYAFSKKSIEDSIAATKALMGAKSVHEALEFQSDFAKTAFDGYVGQFNRFGEIFANTARESIEPLQSRVQAWVEVVQSARAD